MSTTRVFRLVEEEDVDVGDISSFLHGGADTDVDVADARWTVLMAGADVYGTETGAGDGAGSIGDGCSRILSTLATPLRRCRYCITPMMLTIREPKARSTENTLNIVVDTNSV